MADNIAITAGSGTTIAADDIAGVLHQRVKISQGADGSATDVSSAAPLQVTLANTGANATPVVVDLGSNNDVTATNATAANLKAEVVGAGSAGTANSGVLTIQGIASMTPVQIGDNSSSITVDNAQLSVVGGGTEAAAMRVTIASDSTGVLSVDDNGGSLTVDYATTGSGTATGALRVELPTNGTGVIATVGAVTAITNALPAGTNAIGKLAANSGVDIGDVDITSIAAGDNNIGNVDVVTLPALAAGTNAIGKVLPTDQDVTAHTNYAKKYYTSAGAATDGIIWSPAAGKRWHITSIYIQVSAAATVTLEDDKAGGDEAIWKGELAANSGAFMTFDPLYPLASGEDAADLIITTTAGNVYVTCVGYEI